MKDEVIAKDKWAFDQEVTNAFDNMLERSIPGYEDMRSLVTGLTIRFAQPNSAILDLGCSSGGSLLPIIDKLGVNNSYIGVEISEPMSKAAIERFVKFPDLNIEIRDTDLRLDFPREETSVTLSILTLQFIPIEYRQKILSLAFSKLKPGVVFIIVEKILGRDSTLNDLFVELYYKSKGYTEEQINTKRISLEGVLVPVTADWNEQLLLNAGFKHVECFWRSLNFAGWIGQKVV